MKFQALPESLGLTAVLAAGHVRPLQDSAAGSDRPARPAAFTAVSKGDSFSFLLSNAAEHAKRL